MRHSRAKSIYTGAWVYGYPLQLLNKNNIKHFILPLDVDESNFHYDVLVPIDVKTLGESVAKKPDGTTIYVGDILFDDLEDITDLVVYLEDMAVFAPEVNDWDIIEGVMHDWEIIGNIHDNPKLYKSGVND